MSFLHPEFLYYMLPPLLILFGFLLTQKEPQGHFFSDEVMNKLRVNANTLTLKARNALFLLIGVLIVFALSGPVIDDGTIKIKAKSADIMIALDISDSMLAEDVYPNRLKLAKDKAMELLKSAPQERVGVIAFAKNSYLVSPMSFDHSAVGFLLRQLNTDSITEKGTDFLSLLSVVDKTIKKDTQKYLLILSDGGDKKEFSKEIAYAKEKNIVVFILGMGTPKGSPIKLKNGSFIKYDGEIIISKLNENISELATQSGGVYIENVKSTDDIKMLLSEINKISLKKELKSEEVPRYIPLFYFPVGLALFILLIATSSMSKRESVSLPSAFLLFSLLLSSPHAKAGVLDFMELKEAKEAYESGDFEKSAKIYSKYADSSKNTESYFNEGNALYKQGKYEDAIKAYEKARFDDEISRANNSANIGNSYVKKSTIKDLQKAVEFYEKSLELNEDEEVRQNLEAVEKELEKQKKKEQDKKDGDKSDEKKDSKDSDKSDEKKDSKDGDKSDEKKDSKDGDKSDEKKENSQNEKEKDSKDEEKNNSDDMKNQKDKQSKEDKKEENKNENNETKPEPKKDELEKLKKDDNSSSPHAINEQNTKEQMSDAEEKKWLKQLNTKQNTFMYMLNDNKPKESDENEKPW